jgi:hypothetical protein
MKALIARLFALWWVSIRVRKFLE